VDAPQVVAVGLLTSAGRVLVVRRPPGRPLPGLWEFPGGKVEFGEPPWSALVRELEEEVGVRLHRGTLFGVYSHVYDLKGFRAHVVLVAYRVRMRRHLVPDTEDRKWVTRAELRNMAIVAGSRPIVADLLRAHP
jgi:8-oxo-dGTP diphosphatase